VVPLGADRFLIGTRGAVLDADAYLARLWESMDRFRTPDEQAAYLARRGWEPDPSLADAVRELREGGLLYGSGAILSKLREAGGAGATDADSAPRFAAWLTRGRPQLAARSVVSFMGACGGSAPEIRVFDDTPDGSDLPRLSAELERARAAGHAPAAPVILCADRPAVARWCETLASRAGAPRDLVGFAVNGTGDGFWRCGGPRNLVLLSAVGRPFLLNDDDTCFGLRAPGADNERRLLITSRFDCLETRYPEDMDRIRGLPCAPLSPVDAHGRLLGRRVSDCLDIGRTELGDADLGLAELLESGTARVAVTMAGIAGHTGMESGRMVLGLRGPARDAVIRRAADYARARVSRFHVRAAAGWVVSSGAFLMAPSIGLDARQTLPPFMPVGRNDEGIFAMALRAANPAALIGHMPYAVLHDPGPLSPFTEESLHDVRPRVAELMTLLLLNAPPLYGAGPESRMDRLGRHLIEVSSQGAADFEALLFELWLKQMQGYVGFLGNLLTAYKRSPAEWAMDVDRHIQAVADQAMVEHPVSPRDVPGEPDAAFTAAQGVIRRYGELLTAWPALRAAAPGIEEPLMRPLP